MTTHRRRLRLGLAAILSCLLGLVPLVAECRDVLIGSKLAPGFDLGVNSSGGRTDWVTEGGSYIKMAYPAGQQWGAVFMTVGRPKDPPRPSEDFSSFNSVTVELRGDRGGETVAFGVKDNTQYDDGSEAKTHVELSSDWRTYTFPLVNFVGADLAHLYVAAQFIFLGNETRTVYVRNVYYSN